MVALQQCVLNELHDESSSAVTYFVKLFVVSQVTKLIEDSSNTKMARTAISGEKIAAWLVDNEVLSIALEGRLPSNAATYEYFYSNCHANEFTLGLWGRRNHCVVHTSSDK